MILLKFGSIVIVLLYIDFKCVSQKNKEDNMGKKYIEENIEKLRKKFNFSFLDL